MNFRPIQWIAGGLTMGFVAVAFQNCGKAGFETVEESSVGGVNEALGAAPFPVETSINQISYMSCPKSGAVSASNDPMAYPFFHVRFGAFSNDNMLSFKGTRAGVGITKGAFDYVKQVISPMATPIALGNFVRTSPYTNSRAVASALILQSRSKEMLANRPIALLLTDSLSNNLLSTYLGNSGLDANGSPQKVNYFSQAASAQKSVLGSFVVPNAADVESLRNELRNTSMIALGYVDPLAAVGPEGIIRGLIGPDGDPSKRLFGKGYTLNFREPAAATNELPAIQSVGEVDLQSGLAGTPQINSKWVCLPPMTVVRHWDRIWWSTENTATISLPAGGTMTVDSNTPMPPGRVSSSDGQNGVIQLNNTTLSVKARIFQKPGDVAIKQVAMNGFRNSTLGIDFPWGIFHACPNQKASELDTPEKRDRLRIIRRFLPADYYDVNLDLNCVVPTAKAMASGQSCYASGDNDASKYVQYDKAALGCNTDTNKNECPAAVSICYLP